MPMPERLFRLVAPAVLFLAIAAAPAGAATAPCRPDGGPTCQVWTAKVIHVHDGDTLEADVRGDGRGPIRIRVTGIQAMELTTYSGTASRRRGECHAVAAANRFERLVRASRGIVRLSAQDPRSRSGKRWRRSVAVRTAGGWRDVGEIQMAEGRALWLNNSVEWAWNARYADAGERAAAARRGLWNPTACGAGPSAGADLSLRVNWDADGADAQNPNGEWIRIFNGSPGDVPLTGWWVRDSHHRRFRFPTFSAVPAGGSVTVRVGPGRSSETEFHWGLNEAIFENPLGDGRGVGDGGYLFDPDGDLRAYAIYR